MWFDEIAEAENPERAELRLFVHNVRDFLGFVLENRNDFGFLWEGSPDLYELAWDTFRLDVEQGVDALSSAIEEIPQDAIHAHGLERRPLRFKFRVLGSIGSQWERFRGLSAPVREWFKKIIAAIDAVLDSLINAARGIGGVIKEFKDALSALA
jgi:hypothetical protein